MSAHQFNYTALVAHRGGPRPTTTFLNPHVQLDQVSPVALQERVLEAASRLPGVVVGPSNMSMTGTRAFHLQPTGFEVDGPDASTTQTVDGFMSGREFAHLHPARDGSIHSTLPPWLVARVAQNGWCELHPVAGLYGMPLNTVMIYGPRDDDEVGVINELLAMSFQYARGHMAAPRTAFLVDAAHVEP